MGDIEKSLEQQICNVANKFLKASKNKEIQIISHFDTDGVSSAAIMATTLKNLDKRFSLKILKNLEEVFFYDLPKDKITLFLDLASGSLNYIKEANLKDVFIIDHHEIAQKIPENVEIINSDLHNKQKTSASSLTYLFCKEIGLEGKELAKLAVLGMVGDCLEKEIDKLNKHILQDGEIKRKRGLLIYPSTRPLNRVLEFSSRPYIPEVTGNPKGVLELLREVGLSPKSGKYKSIIELDREEMEKLTTAIMLRNPKTKQSNIIGDIFLLKMFNKLEDAREISATVNACSRIGDSNIALQFLMEIPRAKKKAEALHIKYKQHLIEALKFANEIQKTQGKGFIIINAKNNIKDTMIGTIATILATSSIYEEGTIIITLAYFKDKIKISSRMVGKNGRNLREILASVIEKIGGEVGGHQAAAGAIINKTKETEFLDLLKKNLEVELVKV
jgi:RecJ-like exonuclease